MTTKEAGRPDGRLPLSLWLAGEIMACLRYGGMTLSAYGGARRAYSVPCGDLQDAVHPFLLLFRAEFAHGAD